jgi:hypothetical protein
MQHAAHASEMDEPIFLSNCDGHRRRQHRALGAVRRVDKCKAKINT